MKKGKKEERKAKKKEKKRKKKEKKEERKERRKERKNERRKEGAGPRRGRKQITTYSIQQTHGHHRRTKLTEIICQQLL